MGEFPEMLDAVLTLMAGAPSPADAMYQFACLRARIWLPDYAQRED